MESFDGRQILDEIFKRVRIDFKLGISEYLAALKALNGGWCSNEEDCKETLQLLWCQSPSQQEQFLGIWDVAKVTLATAVRQTSEEFKQPSKSQPPLKSPSTLAEIKTTTPQTTEVWEVPSTPRFTSLPTRAPFVATDTETPTAFPADFPLSRRAMVYHWQYVNRPVKDGCEDILDVDETVKIVASQGFFLSPVYTRQETNHAHLLLLVDRNGSMTPFHYVMRELVETANDESSLQKLDVYYFHNVPATSIYRDPYLTESILLSNLLKTCNTNTSVLIVSDGGAARGYRRFERFEATTRFLDLLRQKTNQVAWLNPMPQQRWYRTSAQLIAYRVPMYPMTPQGMSRAIDTIMGKKLS
jgi:uncharacterized protein with von Willebrand factor type A (vWA) domain